MVSKIVTHSVIFRKATRLYSSIPFVFYEDDSLHFVRCYDKLVANVLENQTHKNDFKFLIADTVNLLNESIE